MPVGTRTAAAVDDGLGVWLERDGAPLANDAIILERLSLALRIRHGRSRGDSDHSRDLAVLLDPDRSHDQRCTAASSLGLLPNIDYRVVAAPLFAVWNKHPGGPKTSSPAPSDPFTPSWSPPRPR